MIVGVPKESFPGETRVAMAPSAMPPLVKAGLEIIVESGAGVAAGIEDAAFEEKGAKIVASRAEVFERAGIVIQVRTMGANPEAGRGDLQLVREGQTLIGHCDPLANFEANRELGAKSVQLFSMELMPRITRAQSMDSLSSMATIAGYKAVLLAASHLPRLFPMMMTAAGTLKPARVFVIGAGVAGLQAIATAKRLGAVVEAYDVRPAVKDQVQSVGGKFIEFDLDTAQAEGAGGYAKALGEDFYKKQRELMGQVIAANHVVITTAAVPGGKAPILVTAEMVKGMAPGSVIIDLAAERGGNCELTEPGEVVVKEGVTIIGPTNLPATVPFHASQMYAKNVATFLLHLIKTAGEGAAASDLLTVDPSDEITQGTLVARGGEVVHTRVRDGLGLEPLPEPADEAKDEATQA